MDLELHDVAVMQIILVHHFLPVPAEDHLTTKVRYPHPLVAELASRQGHTL
jgi:hypothetical protein